MAFTDVRAYFRTRMNALSYREWKDGFNFDNIPETILDGSYHMEVGVIDGNQQNQTVLDANMPVTVRLFIKGYRDVATGIDRAIELSQNIICACINPANANGVNIKDVQFSSMHILPLSGTNDNSIICEMTFLTRIFLETTS